YLILVFRLCYFNEDLLNQYEVKTMCKLSLKRKRVVRILLQMMIEVECILIFKERYGLSFLNLLVLK
ncbi:hypothetical protein, partial [Acinetobacter junii]|uniref:hypothetical protein n=1 Tax=Acinetobacter junii TaxID=40215 RepID=UPI001C06B85D